MKTHTTNNRVLNLREPKKARRAEENRAIANRFHAWNQALLGTRGGAAMPRDLVDALRTEFMVPQVTLRLWNLAPEYAGTWFTEGVSDDARLFAASLRAPYCGLNNDFEAVRWLDDPAAVRSTVLMPLSLDGKTFGLLVLGAPNDDRFTSTMATDFLVHIAPTASTALAPLRA